MTAGAGISLLRGFALAEVLEIGHFGWYAATFALATFAASLLALGEIERSFKRFPRLIARGEIDIARAEAQKTSVKIVVRAAIIAGFASAALALAGHFDLIIGAILTAGVAASAAIQSCYISLQRSGGRIDLVGLVAFFRPILSLLLAVGGAILAEWEGALLGELIAAGAGAVLCRRFLAELDTSHGSQGKPTAALAPLAPEREMWLFFGFTLSAIPLYLDRSIVALLYDDQTLGTYAFLMLFVMGAFTFSSVVVQKVGPQLIRMTERGEPVLVQMRRAFLWILIVACTSAGGLSIVAAGIFLGPLDGFALKFQLEPGVFLAAAALASLQVNLVLEWFLIARNGERYVFLGAVGYVMLLAAAVVFAATTHPHLAFFIWALAAAKSGQLAILSFAVARVVTRA